MTCRPARTSEGSSLVGLLVALAILAGLALSILLAIDGSSSAPKSITSSTTLPSTSPLAAGANIDAATVAACQADYAAAGTAVTAYQLQTGYPPSNITELRPYLRDPLTSARFSITIDPHHPGRLQVTMPGQAPTDSESGCAE